MKIGFSHIILFCWLGFTTLPLFAQIELELGNDTISCGSLLLDAKNPGASYRWNTGEDSRQINVNTSGLYWVVVSRDGATVRDSINVEIVPEPQELVINDTIICGNGIYQFSAGEQQELTETIWYKDSLGNEIIGIGETFSPYLSKDTSFYVANANLSQQRDIGEEGLPNKFGISSQVRGLRFDLEKNTLIKSVSVHVLGSTSFTMLLTHRGDTIYQKDFQINEQPGQEKELLLYWELPPGTDYRMVAVNIKGGGLGYLSQSTAYPYEIPKWISIFRALGGGTDLYFYFFDWKIGEVACKSPITQFSVTSLLPFSLPDSVYTCEAITLSTGIDSASHIWSTGANTSAISASKTDLYWVSVDNGKGCRVNDSVIVEFPKPVGLPEDGILCGSNLTTNYSSEVPHNWSTGEVGASIEVQAQGVYSVSILEPNGCLIMDMIRVDGFAELPVFELPSLVQACAGDSFWAPIKGVRYLWSNQSTDAPILLKSSGLYWVEIENESGCIFRDSMQVNVSPAPKAQFTFTQSGCTFFMLNQSTPIEDYEYTWNFGDGQFSNAYNPIHTYEVPADYMIQLEVRGKCEKDAAVVNVNCLSVSISDSLKTSLNVYPNPFNTFIYLDQLSLFPFSELSIYDEMGRLIFKSKGTDILPSKIHTQNWRSGLYVLKVKDRYGVVHRQKLIKPHSQL